MYLRNVTIRKLVTIFDILSDSCNWQVSVENA